MRRWLRNGRRALADYFVRRLWQSLVAFGAAHDPFAAQYAEDEQPPRQRPGGPPPAHPERLREDVPLTAEELRILRELWPAHTEHRTPDGK
ncbi:DUF6059 family protein [Streptomyces sp. DH24]|uniref:DUF6059 family protein n=1 Tax=Streptomyces sp. DH24 TaxID=3040123 RepID=UPI00244145FF|nr:DUF6059 family protein [Streptomyces sp. DH24]MDG9720163.1 hypothetical protein [Streptomyces sp. DH24]